jgi:hypothetical protein
MRKGRVTNYVVTVGWSVPSVPSGPCAPAPARHTRAQAVHRGAEVLVVGEHVAR